MSDPSYYEYAPTTSDHMTIIGKAGRGRTSFQASDARYEQMLETLRSPGGPGWRTRTAAQRPEQLGALLDPLPINPFQLMFGAPHRDHAYLRRMLNLRAAENGVRLVELPGPAPHANNPSEHGCEPGQPSPIDYFTVNTSHLSCSAPAEEAAAPSFDEPS